MGCLIFLILITIPVAELAVLIEVGDAIGAFQTVAVCMLTAAVGLVIVRAQGLDMLRTAQAQIDQGATEALAKDALNGLFLLLAAVFLMIPGFMTDGVGFLLLVPPLRRSLASHVHFVPGSVVHYRAWTSRTTHHSGDIDGEYRDVSQSGTDDDRPSLSAHKGSEPEKSEGEEP